MLAGRVRKDECACVAKCRALGAHGKSQGVAHIYCAQPSEASIKRWAFNAECLGIHLSMKRLHTALSVAHSPEIIGPEQYALHACVLSHGIDHIRKHD
jgi:hypothetical protein